MRARISSRGALVFLVASGAVCETTLAEDFAGAPRVTEATLDEVRGGFDFPENLHASLKLERIAQVNGETVAHLVVEIPDIAKMTTEQATQLAAAAGTLVIQNGVANTFNLADLGPAATVIQNTLNDQNVLALTTISVGVNSLGAFRETAFQDGLSQALGAVAGVR